LSADLERRQDRIEHAIERLTEISSDLNKMIAVQDQKLSQQEKSTNLIADMLEKRREEYEKKLQTVYDVMNREDNKVIEELEMIRSEQKQQHEEISRKLTAMEKIIWIYMGGFSVIMFLITNSSVVLKFFK
jgi:predicted RNase H-like nuclease (RuvC/YqgF family)